MDHCSNEITRLSISSLSRNVLMELNKIRSLDHLVRTLDSAIYGLKDIYNGWSEDGVRCLFDLLGEKFAPYIMRISLEKETINSWAPRYYSLRKWFAIIDEYAKFYEEKGVKPALLGAAKPAAIIPIQVEEGEVYPRRIPNRYKGYRPVEYRNIKYKNKQGGRAGRILGYLSLIILSLGIVYFTYALMVKYGLLNPITLVPCP